MIRIDISPSASSQDPEVLAAPVEHGLEAQSGYRLIGWARTTFARYDALRWEFAVREEGMPLRKVDTFFAADDGSGVAFLVQAPAVGYQFWTPVFRVVRDSFTFYDTATGETLTEPPAPPPTTTSRVTPAPAVGSFCDTHPCIANFDNGNGYIVQCADGMWSHSGGLPGACSYHGGETGNTYDGAGQTVTPIPAPSIGAGNGYPVLCVDGTVSNSGGIQGACSHHGGEAP